MFEKSFKNEALGFELTSYIDKQQNVWFKGKDVAKILGYSDTKQAIRKHVSTENKIIQLIHPKSWGGKTPPQQNNNKGKCYPGKTPGQGRKAGGVVSTPQVQQGRWYTFINEPGFYELVFSSKLEFAKKFRQWVFTTVLPSIRKYGYFKLFKLENETRKKQRVIIDGKKYYKHPVFSNYAASKSGDIISLRTKKIMSLAKCGGYLYFVICDKKLEKRKNYYQHRFVYEVFKGPIPKNLEIDHINNCKIDNRIINLQLLNHKQNVGKSRNKSIISTTIENGEKKVFISITKAANELGIYAGSISNICRKRKYYKSATSKKDGKKYSFKYLN